MYRFHVKGTDGRLSSQELAGIRDGHVWYDFFSVPQSMERWMARETDMPGRGVGGVTALHSDHRHSSSAPPLGMVEAINSLPSYMQRSTMFVVLAPVCTHVDRECHCEFGTWSARGWCNVEWLASVLTPSRDAQKQLIVKGFNHSLDIEVIWEVRASG